MFDLLLSGLYNDVECYAIALAALVVVSNVAVSFGKYVLVM